ncbi:MAG: HAMP domain-containing protein [Clostridia bacterium]|nr:HAMP domain-containing protein [Clostridia bacterium]
MKKRSVLKRRAALYTAAVMTVAVAVGLSAFALVSRTQTNAAARAQLIPMAGYFAHLASEDPANAPDRLADEAGVVASSGGSVWLVPADGDARAACLTGEQPLPEQADSFRRDGVRYARSDAPIAPEGGEWSAVAVALPVRGAGAIAWVVAAAASALVGALIAALALRRQARARKAIDDKLKAIGKLRDVAVAMSEGELEQRADESAEGEIGELGRAVNNLSAQLSRNMYTLIVERNRLRNMLNGLSEAIVAIDAEGHVTHTNPALDRFFTRQKLALHLPDPRMKLIPDKSIWEDFDGVIRTGEAMTRNLESRDMILRLTITPIVDEIGAIAGAVGLFSDITQMERLEKTRRDYVSNVSHELRTPLTAMRALIEPLKEGMVTEEADRQRYYDIILREILRLSRLINDQLELSRLQSGTLSIQKSVMALDDVVYDVCDRYGTIAAEHGLELKVGTDFTACPQVYANADRVEQMLIILVDNAIKYTEQGSVTVWADWDDARVVIHVKDTGIGIEENDLPYVFDRFYKVDKAHSGKGSGLGLSIARELLKRMDEDIWVTSEKGEGTEFSFTLHRPGSEV